MGIPRRTTCDLNFANRALRRNKKRESLTWRLDGHCPWLGQLDTVFGGHPQRGEECTYAVGMTGSKRRDDDAIVLWQLVPTLACRNVIKAGFFGS
jgi:hypothetical protein